MKRRTTSQNKLIGAELVQLEIILYEYFARLQSEALELIKSLRDSRIEILTAWQRENPSKQSAKGIRVVHSAEGLPIYINICSGLQTRPTILESWPITTVYGKINDPQSKNNVKKFSRRFLAVKTLKEEVTNINNTLVKNDTIQKQVLYDEFKLVASGHFTTLEANQPSWWEKPFIEQAKALIKAILPSRLVSLFFNTPKEKLDRFCSNPNNIQTYSTCSEIREAKEEQHIRISI